MITIEPSATFAVPDSMGVIWVTTDGLTLWASTTGAVLRIDAATSKVAMLPAPTKSDDTVMLIANDGLWVGRWAGGHVYRLDPATGDVQLTVAVPAAVRLQLVGDELWVGREDTGSMILIDRSTGALGRSIERGAYAISGLGDLWFTVGLGPRIERVDAATGAVKATIDAEGEDNCSISGDFPANVWLSCFGRDVIPRTVSRIDTTTNQVAATAMLPPMHGGSVVVIDGQPWFVGVLDDAAGRPVTGLLRLDPATGTIVRFVSIGAADSDGAFVAGDAVWFPDEANHRIIRVSLADLSR